MAATGQHLSPPADLARWPSVLRIAVALAADVVPRMAVPYPDPTVRDLRQKRLTLAANFNLARYRSGRSP